MEPEWMTEEFKKKLESPWVVNYVHSKDDMQEFISRAALEPHVYVDCFLTPVGSVILGTVKCRKLDNDIYRMIYVVRRPSGEVSLGEGDALFGEEPQKFEQRMGLGSLGFEAYGMD